MATESRARHHKARHLVEELRTLRKQVDLARQLAKTDDEMRWCNSLADALDHLVLVGDAVFGGKRPHS